LLFSKAFLIASSIVSEIVEAESTPTRTRFVRESAPKSRADGGGVIVVELVTSVLVGGTTF
jgi:hypothetical protein